MTAVGDRLTAVSYPLPAGRLSATGCQRPAGRRQPLLPPAGMVYSFPAAGRGRGHVDQAFKQRVFPLGPGNRIASWVFLPTVSWNCAAATA